MPVRAGSAIRPSPYRWFSTVNPRVREGLGSGYFPSGKSTLVPGLGGGASAGSIFPASTCSWYQAIHSSLSFACPRSSDCFLISSEQKFSVVVEGTEG